MPCDPLPLTVFKTFPWKPLGTLSLFSLSCLFLLGPVSRPNFGLVMLSSVQFSHSVVSNSLPRHELQHTRPPCPSPTPRVYSNSFPSSWWCHPAISSSVAPFLLLPPIPPSIRVFSSESTLNMRWPKYWSFSFSISPSNGHPGLIDYFMANRWGKKGNSYRFYFLGLQNHCRWWLQPWN